MNLGRFSRKRMSQNEIWALDSEFLDKFCKKWKSISKSGSKYVIFWPFLVEIAENGVKIGFDEQNRAFFPKNVENRPKKCQHRSKFSSKMTNFQHFGGKRSCERAEKYFFNRLQTQLNRNCPEDALINVRFMRSAINSDGSWLYGLGISNPTATGNERPSTRTTPSSHYSFLRSLAGREGDLWRYLQAVLPHPFATSHVLRYG